MADDRNQAPRRPKKLRALAFATSRALRRSGRFSGLLAAAGAFIVANMFGLAWLERKLLFPRDFIVPPQVSHTSGLERWWIDTEQGRVEVWFLPGRGVSGATPGPLVLYAHGNGELIDHWPDTLGSYRKLGVSVLLPEYRGYGRSAGTPSQDGIVADMRAALERALADARVDATRVVYHGRSLGGGVICALTKQRAARGLILESTFTSVVDVARGMGVPPFLIYDRFESLPVVRAFQGPLLVLHGARDTLIPVRHAERLAAANPRAKLVKYDVGHNDLPPAASDYWDQITELLQRAFAE